MRSIGLEVLNELGPIKGALMEAAGAETKQDMAGSPRRHDAAAWLAAASGIETLSGGIRIGKAVVSGLGSVMGGLVRNVMKNGGR